MYLKSLYNTNLQLNLQNIKSNITLDNQLLHLLQQQIGNKCNQHGYIKKDSLSIIKRNIGSLCKNGDIKYNILYEAIITLPIIGSIISVRIISNEQIFFIGNYNNIFKVIIQEPDLQINNIVNIIVLDYYFTEYNSNIIVFGKYINNIDTDYSIPEIPTKDMCQNYINKFFSDQSLYNIIDSKSITNSINIDSFDSFNYDSLNNINSNINNNETITDYLSETNKESNEITTIYTDNDDNKKIYDDEEFNDSEDNTNISTIYAQYKSETYKLSVNYDNKKNLFGITNPYKSCYINSLLFLFKYNDTFKNYVNKFSYKYLHEIKKYLNTTSSYSFPFDSLLLLNNLQSEFNNIINIYSWNNILDFYNIFLQKIDNHNIIGKKFYNLKNIPENILQKDPDYETKKLQNIKFNKEYSEIQSFTKQLYSSCKGLNNIKTTRVFCKKCLYETTEVSIVNILNLDIPEKINNLQDIIDYNINEHQLNIKCSICNEDNLYRTNKYNIISKDLLLYLNINTNISNYKIDNSVIINNDIKMKPISYILQFPNYNSEIKHYRTFIESSKLLHDDDNTYKLKPNELNTNEINIIHLSNN